MPSSTHKRRYRFLCCVMPLQHSTSDTTEQVHDREEITEEQAKFKREQETFNKPFFYGIHDTTFTDVYYSEICKLTVVHKPLFQIRYGEAKEMIAVLKNHWLKGGLPCGCRIPMEHPTEELSQPSFWLKCSTCSRDTDTECCICLEGDKDPRLLMYLPCCNSRIHVWCLMMSQYYSTVKCPLCRHNLSRLQTELDTTTSVLWQIFHLFDYSVHQVQSFADYMITEEMGFTTTEMMHYIAIQKFALERLILDMKDELGIDMVPMLEPILKIFPWYTVASKRCTRQIMHMQSMCHPPLRWLTTKICPLEYPMDHGRKPVKVVC